ncbi:MAG: DNA primase [Clostridiales bacterium]|nr:DNA primase [Clostridiales bacterium]
MGRIPERVIDEILDKADIESVVGHYVSFTKRSGSNLKGLCPFHSEKTPSFNVNTQKNIYKCFGCGKGGNAINFIMNIESLSYPEAVKFLGAKYGVDVPEEDSDYRESHIKQHKERVRKLLSDAEAFFIDEFKHSPDASVARSYAAGRQLDPDTCDKFGIGYAPAEWGVLKSFLVKKGYTEQEMADSGLFSVSSNGDKIFELFRGRLMFPIKDAFGNTIAFGGRNLGKELPKYINSPDSAVYKKQDNLYAYNIAKKERSKTLIVVEGYMDVIAMHKAGFSNTVAALGTAFTDSQLRLCARTGNCEEVVFFFDSDAAGQKAALRAIQMMIKYLRRMSGMMIIIKIAKVPGGKDPDEFIRQNGTEAFAKVVESAQTMSEYLAQRAYNDNVDENDKLDTARYLNDICLYGSWTDDEIARDIIAGEASKKLNMRIEVIINRMAGLASNDREREAMMEARGLGRMREEEIENRRSYQAQEQLPQEYYDSQVPPPETGALKKAEDVPQQDVPPGFPTFDQPQMSEDEIADPMQISLMAHALSLNELLCDKSMVDKEDIVRAGDFRCPNLKKMIREYYELYTEGTGVSVARFIDVMSKYLLNGRPAEDVILEAMTKCDRYSDSKVLRDMYLAILYKVRLEQMTVKEEELVKKMSLSMGEDREHIIQDLKKIDLYKKKIKDKESRI